MLVCRSTTANGTLLFVICLLLCTPCSPTQASSGPCDCKLSCRNFWYRYGHQLAQVTKHQDRVYRSRSHIVATSRRHRRHTGSQDSGPSFAYDDICQPELSFQWVWQERPSRFTVLFTTTAHDYETGMIRVFYDLVDAMLDHPDARVLVWGPGYQGWVDENTIEQNMRSRFRCGEVDVHINFLAVFSDVVNADGRLYKQWEEYKPCPEEVLFEELPDCHDYVPYAPALKCEARRGHKEGTIVSARYAFLLMDLFYPMQHGQAGMMVHTPDCANPTKVFPIKWEHKTFNASLVGGYWKLLYPLRNTMREAILADLIHGGTVYEHPGYWPFERNGSRPSATYVMDAPMIQPATDSYRSFITRMQHSKICMFDSTIIRKSIAKFYEAFLAGCVVASDLPDEMQELFKDAIIILDPGASKTEVAEAINAALEDEPELQRKAVHAYHIGMEHFTCHRKAERILDYVAEFRNGYRGYNFPYGFKSSCKNYHFNEQSGLLLQPWCSGQRPNRTAALQ